MPLGFERLNERTQRPNAHINFIRTLPGPSSSTAEHILNRVAAVCYPFMKTHTILVQALEEYPYNREFVGRNFNAGEVIQLVLRDARGRWLPQRMVEMVMVHELAHCKQMNHSKAFWKVRDEYAGQLRGLCARGYTGEGLWGRGRELDSGALQARDGEIMDIPEHLCGGTYGRRGGKRRRGGKDKEKEKVSYAERKQRRILKKFGAGGLALGAADEDRIKLEGGVPKKGKPRVAGSARGRDLRAAAALARFDTMKPKEEDEVAVKKEEPWSGSDTEDDFIEGDQLGAAVDIDGTSMFDDKGRALIKICEDEDDKDGDARREMDEIQGFASPPVPTTHTPVLPTTSTTKQPRPSKHQPVLNTKPPNTHATPTLSKLPPTTTATPTNPKKTLTPHVSNPQPTKTPTTSPSPSPSPPTHLPCPICSLTNPASALTCTACAHVLQPHLMPHVWRCRSTVCMGGLYVNAGDAGRCGVCGGTRGDGG